MEQEELKSEVDEGAEVTVLKIKTEEGVKVIKLNYDAKIETVRKHLEAAVPILR